MLSLTKKNDAEQVAAPLWHTNFRNFDSLPDTKVVRTTFFINTAAIVVALGLLMWLGFREYHILTINRQIAEAQQQIDSNDRQNKEALRLTKIFADEEKKLLEVSAFQRTPISPAEFVNLLGKSLPKEISIEFVEARMPDTGNGIFQLRGLVAGTPEQASGTASSYVDMLRAHPRLGVVFNPIALDKLNRDVNTGPLSIEISMRVKPEAKEKK